MSLALAQRRQRDLEDVDPVEEVLAELAGGPPCGQVLVRRGDDPDVDLDRLGAADRRERALLQHPQQLDLQRRRHVADLVEEEGAAVGDLEQPGLILDRAGERAADVAEQRALEQVVVERRAVLDHERLLGARPVVVDRAGDQLLAGAALAVDEHGRLAADDLLQQPGRVAHRRARADDLGERVLGRGRGRRRGAGPRRHPGDLGGGGGDQIAQPLEVGLGQARDLGDVLLGVALDLGELADLAQELGAGDRRQLGAHAAADEDEADQLARDPDRRGDDVEAEVAVVHVRRRSARPARWPGPRFR
jgi:hypothetical protein